MRIAILPLLALVGLICVVVVILSVVLNVNRDDPKNRRRDPGRRPGNTPPGYRHPPEREPTVRIGRLILAIVFFPIVLLFWAVASIGDVMYAAIHAIVSAMAIVFAVLGSLAGSNSSAQWRAAGRELNKLARSIYAIGRRFVEFVGFGGFLDRVEDGIRDARRGAPSLAPTPPLASAADPRHTFAFEDRYRIEGTLAGGGSTARLFVVRRLERDKPVGDRLVLKYFDMGLGSRLEEVMRESRGMQVAREMGIVLDHDLGPEHFYYTMPYYEGETLTRAVARIHRRLLTGAGMEKEDLETCLGWMSEALRILDAYHRRGVIHKDVKPDNLIVTEEGIRLVDLGLMTPVESALTLTTHGTEYFRDPEMVKLAVAGKRVRDVDAARFDIYSSGAVLYLLLEGSFPACGPLSRFSRPVPMALTAITSRAMAEGAKRYPTITAMRTDLEAYRQMLASREPNEIPVTALPSLAGENEENFREDVEDVEEISADESLASVPPAPPPPPLQPAPPVMTATPAPVPPKPAKSGAGKAWAYAAIMLGLVVSLFVFLYFITLRVEEPLEPPTASGAPAPPRNYELDRQHLAYTSGARVVDVLETHRGARDATDLSLVVVNDLGWSDHRILQALRSRGYALITSRDVQRRVRGKIDSDTGTLSEQAFEILRENVSEGDVPCVLWLHGEPGSERITVFGLLPDAPLVAPLREVPNGGD